MAQKEFSASSKTHGAIHQICIENNFTRKCAATAIPCCKKLDKEGRQRVKGETVDVTICLPQVLIQLELGSKFGTKQTIGCTLSEMVHVWEYPTHGVIITNIPPTKIHLVEGCEEKNNMY